jgi:hypothetical protein
MLGQQPRRVAVIDMLPVGGHVIRKSDCILAPRRRHQMTDALVLLAPGQ